MRMLNDIEDGKDGVDFVLVFKLSRFLWIKSSLMKRGSNAFTMSPTKWIETTGAIGIVCKSGRYGGTYAHSDIAFEFASWISAEFKLY